MTRLRFSSAALTAVLALLSLQCSGDIGTQPTTATTIAKAGGDGQSGAVGTALSNPLVVVVTDASGGPVQGVTVTWSAGGSGSVSSPTVQTGSDGKASVQRTLGDALGPQTTTATVSGLDGSPVTFTSTAVAGQAASIAITTNPPTSALTGEVFDPSVQPAVLVKDATGAPAGGVQVTATITSGGGTLQGTTTVTTGSDGVAKFGDLGIEGSGDQILQFSDGSESVTASPVTLSALPAEASTGKWGPLVNWDIVPLHMHLLPTGKIMAWGKYEMTGVTGTMGDRPRLWDPANGPPTTAQTIQVDTMLFCAGHAFMSDGTLLVSGGHKADDTGINVTNFFSPTGAWTKGPNMAHGRWYPTVTELPDGRMLTMAGRDENGNVVTTPEIWENGGWVELPGAGTLEIPYYPRNFVDPKSGLIFMAGERTQSRWFDPDGTGVNGNRGKWISGPQHVYQKNRDYGTAVMYDSGKILYAGGGGDVNWPTPDPKASTPTNTAEIINLNASSPGWTNTDAMAFPRRHLNSTVLPDGTVLVTGGTTGGGFVDINTADAARDAELWNPKTGHWTTLAANSVMRVYHSVSLLLPDGTVLHGASGNAMSGTQQVPDQQNHEIFSPPYLFKGARPTITSVSPSTVSYGGTFTVATPNAAQITDVRWIRIGTVTHAFDAGQLANTLGFTTTATGVTVTAPPSAFVAPPGYYMVFILNRNGVPSTGKMVRIQ